MRLIDAEAFREIMYQKCFVEDSKDTRWDSGHWLRYRLFEKALEDAPTLDAEPVRHGRWIDTGSGQECSVCGEVQYGYDSFRNYCAHCGADMRKEIRDGRPD